FFFFSSRRRHTRFSRDWSSDVCSSDLMHHRESNDFLGFEATRQAAQRAYAQAGVTAPRRDLDVVECHDCFTITEILNTEDLGLAEPGEGGKLLASGATAAGGDIPVNLSGGL